MMADDEVRPAKNRSAAVQTGVSLFTCVGVAVAVQISWSINHSIGWAIWHGFLNWIYVVYRLVVGMPSG
jgi:hypothetical protein